jgi:hypothetical protein
MDNLIISFTDEFRVLLLYLPGRTREHYYQDNKEEIDEYQRQYRQHNKDVHQIYIRCTPVDVN